MSELGQEQPAPPEEAIRCAICKAVVQLPEAEIVAYGDGYCRRCWKRLVTPE